MCELCNGSMRVRYSKWAPNWVVAPCPICVVEVPPDPNGLPVDLPAREMMGDAR